MKYTSILLFLHFLLANAYININILGTGLFLPYSIGVIGYIKKHIPMEEYRLTGISGGAWCSLLYAFEDDLSDHDKIWNYTIGDPNIKIVFHNNLNVFHKNMENNMKKRYKNIQKDTIKNLPISIIGTNYNVNKCKLYNEKVSEFDNINDLIDFCLCSSYIPYLSGSLMCLEYKNKYYMDGDIMRNRDHTKIGLGKCSITIHRDMWGRKFNLSNFVYIDRETSRELFKQGWEDTERNKDFIMRCFRPLLQK